MTKFRKKPVEIEAVRVTREINEERPSWFIKAIASSSVYWSGEHYTVRTLEGDMRAEIGDWIVCGIKGELYPCKPDIFAATYDPA